MKTKTLPVFCFGHRSLCWHFGQSFIRLSRQLQSQFLVQALFAFHFSRLRVCVCIFDLHLSGPNAQKRIRSGPKTKGHSIKMRFVCRARNSQLAAKHLIQFEQLISPRKFQLNYGKMLILRSCHIDYIVQQKCNNNGCHKWQTNETTRAATQCDSPVKILFCVKTICTNC